MFEFFFFFFSLRILSLFPELGWDCIHSVGRQSPCRPSVMQVDNLPWYFCPNLSTGPFQQPGNTDNGNTQTVLRRPPLEFQPTTSNSLMTVLLLNRHSIPSTSYLSWSWGRRQGVTEVGYNEKSRTTEEEKTVGSEHVEVKTGRD